MPIAHSQSTARGRAPGGRAPIPRRLALIPIAAWIAFLLLTGGCSFFGLGGDAEGGSGEDGVAADDPFANGVLNTASYTAPPGSNVQYLARLAQDMGWEDEVAQDVLLREAVEKEEFGEKVEPRLLGLFFKMGFSVLPKVGEGHEFNRDTVVRGDVANSRFLVRSREEIRIVFLGLAENIVVIYPKEGIQPRIFSRVESSTVAVRESRLEHYLN